MNERTMLRSKIFGAACVMAFASSIAFAQTAQDTNSAPPAAAASSAPSDAAAAKGKAKQSEKKTQEGGQAKAANSEAKPKRGQYATEAEAKAHCSGEVVWVDKDNFNHYPGSREYGRKPGAFACES